jgi:hypothetical protein
MRAQRGFTKGRRVLAGHGCGRHLWDSNAARSTVALSRGLSACAGGGKAASAHFVVRVVRAPTRRTPPDRVVELPGSEALGKRQPLLQILILFFNLRDHTRSPAQPHARRYCAGFTVGLSGPQAWKESARHTGSHLKCRTRSAGSLAARACYRACMWQRRANMVAPSSERLGIACSLARV